MFLHGQDPKRTSSAPDSALDRSGVLVWRRGTADPARGTMSIHLMKRRDFIAVLGGAAAWPLVARAQSERVRRIGMLMNLTADDPEAAARFNALAQGLQQLGWIVGRNVQIEHR